MNDQPIRFHTARREGVLVHLGITILLTLVVLALFLMATGAPLGLPFLLYLLGALFLAVPIPVLIYRLYALLRSFYELDRNGIRLQWGLRVEDIPMSEVLSIQIMEDLEKPIALPRLRLPGALLGTQTDSGVGKVEFMASKFEGLVLINTPNKVFVISPEDRNKFQRVFQEKTEMGSLAPLQPYSSSPQFLFFDIWRIPTARIFLVTSLVLSLALFLWVSLVVQVVPEVSLGFSSTGEPNPPVSSGQLFLLPVVNALLLVASYVLSLYFFRQSKKHPLMYLLWGSNVFTALLFLAAVYFILQSA